MILNLDRKILLDVCITVIATFVSVDFIVFSYVWNDYATQILSVLVIILPTIYIVGNLIIRGVMKDEYRESLSEVGDSVDEMWGEIERLQESKKFK